MATPCGPGFTVPVMALPSHFISTRTWTCLPADGLQSPVQLPLSGCPNCAETGTAAARNTTKPTARLSGFRIDVSSFRGSVLYQETNLAPVVLRYAHVRHPHDDTT